MVALFTAGAGAAAGAGAGLDLDDHESQSRPASPSFQLRLFPSLPFAHRRRSAGPTVPPGSGFPVNGLSNEHEHCKRSSFMAEHGRSRQARAASDSVRPKDATVRFREPQQDEETARCSTLSDDEESLVSSELSADQPHGAGLQKKHKKCAPRKATRYAMAYPAPQLLTKQRSLVQIRPRLLLQLQEVGQKRAMPAFDVVPSTLIAGSLIIPKLSKRFPRMFRMKPHMNPNDLLLVRSEHYRLPSSSSLSAESSTSLDDRDVLAVISTLAEQDDNSVEIVFPDGSIWTTSLMANGSYEFTRTNQRGETVKARWVKRTLSGSKTSWGQANANPNADFPTTSPTSTIPEHKWTFSIIDPLTRRHPIRGVLTQTTLDIFDTYTTLSTTSINLGSENSNNLDRSASPTSGVEERLKMEVTEEDKKLMLATAIWISLRQKGWPWYASPKLAKAISSCTTATPGTTPSRSRSTSPIYADLDASIPLVSSCDTFAPSPSPPSAPHASAAQPKKSIRRALSSGSEHARKRREAPELANLEEEKEEADNDDHDGGAEERMKSKLKANEDGCAPSCRLRIRRFTHKLFHPKSQLVL